MLSTLVKALESVIAERISYAVEIFGLLPPNYFGARKNPPRSRHAFDCKNTFTTCGDLDRYLVWSVSMSKALTTR